MLSGRFDRPSVVAYMKTVKSGLEAQGIKTFMVDCGAGQSYAEPTMEGMFNAWAMVVFGTDHYGAKTGAQYETYTYFELRYAHQNKLLIIPVQLCESWPPRPTDFDGKSSGATQNSFVLDRTLMRVLDQQMKEPQRVADEIAGRLLEELDRDVVSGRGLNS